MFKEQKGITLIALVVTIIVLLILAGVTIAMLTGENGILTQASRTDAVNERAQAEEQAKLAYMAVRTQIATNLVENRAYDATTAESLTALAAIVSNDLSGDGWDVTEGANAIEIEYTSDVLLKPLTYTIDLTKNSASFDDNASGNAGAVPGN